MPKTQANQITLESSPNYFERPWVPNRIYKFNHTIKLILIVRDPVTRILSEYAHNSAMGREERTHPIREMMFDRSGGVNQHYRFLYIGNYYSILPNWLRYFPMEQIHIADGDAFRKKPVPELQKIEQFLGVEPFLNKSHFVYNTKKKFYCIKGSGCMGSDKGRRHPMLEQRLLKNLHTYYKPFNDKFYALINRKFEWDKCLEGGNKGLSHFC